MIDVILLLMVDKDFKENKESLLLCSSCICYSMVDKDFKENKDAVILLHGGSFYCLSNIDKDFKENKDIKSKNDSVSSVLVHLEIRTLRRIRMYYSLCYIIRVDRSIGR